MLVTDLDGQPHPKYPFWDAATMKDPEVLQGNLALLPEVAETGLCQAGKDVSMGGIIGTTLMLLETSGCGAVLNIDAIPRPEQLPLEQWLLSFPSYGFLLAVSPGNLEALQGRFRERGLACEAIGTLSAGQQLILEAGSDSAAFWSFSEEKLTGFRDL